MENKSDAKLTQQRLREILGGQSSDEDDRTAKKNAKRFCNKQLRHQQRSKR